MKRMFHSCVLASGAKYMSLRVTNLPWATTGRASAVLALILFVMVDIRPASASRQGSADSGIAGTWRGTLGSGAAQLRIVLSIAKLSNGEYGGQLNSVDQGAVI